MSFSDEPAGDRSVLEDAFEFWLANYRAGELGGLPAAHFLTRKHLMAAYAAGVAAHERAAAREDGDREVPRAAPAGLQAPPPEDPGYLVHQPW